MVEMKTQKNASAIEYDVFISYARQDGRDHAIRLYDALSARGLKPWRDERDLSPYMDFGVGIERAIRAAKVVAVLLTPSIVGRDDSFVRRETYYAQAQGKPILVLAAPEFQGEATPVNIAHLTRHPIPATPDSLNKVIELLSIQPPTVLPHDDPFRQHVLDLLEYILGRLEGSLLNDDEMITLKTSRESGKVRTQSRQLPTIYSQTEWRIRERTSAQVSPPYDSFASAFEDYQGRMLLLGAPGAGKSTSLLAFAREKCYERLAHPGAALPVFVPLIGWDGQRPLFEWIAEQTTVDVMNNKETERVLLMLDGLDEALVERRNQSDPDTVSKQELRDLRLEVMSAVASISTSVLVTCRIDDYDEVIRLSGEKIALNGAIRIEPLTPEQVVEYLHNQPELVEALNSDSDLMEMARTPLLLTLLAFGYSDVSDAEREQLRSLRGSPAELRARVFKKYVEKRYEFEALKRTLEMSLEELNRLLGEFSLTRLARFRREEFDLAAKLFREDDPFIVDLGIELALRLHLLRDDDTRYVQFVHQLFRDYFAFPIAMEFAEHEHPYIREIGIQALGKIGDSRATKIVLKALRDKHTLARYYAADALGRLGGPVAQEGLYMALEDLDPGVRVRAALALAKLGDARCIQPMIQMLTDATDRISHSHYLEKALGRLGAKAIMPIVEAMPPLGSTLPGRMEVLESIRWIRDENAIGPLISLLEHRDDGIQFMARQALAAIGLPAIPALCDLIRQGKVFASQSAKSALFGITDERAVLTLLDLINDPNADIRICAVQALGNIGDFRATASLIAALESDPSRAVRERAAESLGKIGDAQSVVSLINATRVPDKYFRKLAVEALGCIGDGSAIPCLISLLRDPDLHVREASSQALGQVIDATSFELLVNGLFDPDPNFRVGVLEAMGRIALPNTSPCRRETLNYRSNEIDRFDDDNEFDRTTNHYWHDADVWEQKRESGRKMLAPVVPKIIGALSDSSELVRSSACITLGMMGETTAVPHLHRILQEDVEVVKRAARHALRGIPTTASSDQEG